MNDANRREVKPLKTVGFREAMRKHDEGMAREVARWADELDAARRANAWDRVQAVARDLRMTAAELEELSGRVLDELGIGGGK